MSYQGHISNGTVIFDEPVSLPEGTPVRVETVCLTTDFWQSVSLGELARRQGVAAPRADEEVLGGWPADELNDGFEDAVRSWRESELEPRG
jgi:hypothetical protein